MMPVSKAPRFEPLTHASFGVSLTFEDTDASAMASEFIALADEIRARFNAAGGLMVVKSFAALEADPSLFARISSIFGPEVENYHETLTSKRFFHDTEPEILVLSNLPPCNHPPPPKHTRSHEGPLPVQFPDQRNWHTDQSYRRPPPDISLLYAVATPPPNQGQTLFADCTAAYKRLPSDLRKRVDNLNGIHCPSWVGRKPDDVRASVVPRPLLPHQQPQRHPLVRIHPDTGHAAIYVCEEEQMDFVDGPIEGLEPGPDGEGAMLLRELLRHSTQPDLTYTHEWAPGDLVIADNRCLLHAATWYDADRFPRVMWRTTVMGNPGAEYRGNAKSWIPKDGYSVMQGMEDA